MKLFFHDYKYYPYERQLALREVSALLGEHNVKEISDGVELSDRDCADTASRLVYFSQVHRDRVAIETVQARLERAVTAGKRRQATRYSVHGLHEYKGKFNPQIAKAILNIFGAHPGDYVLDPFCGSGTTLVECSHLQARALGVDKNPLAVFIANAKLHALTTPSDLLLGHLARLEKAITKVRRWQRAPGKGERERYLEKWFDDDQLCIIEILKDQIIDHSDECASIFLCIASNLLRDYSQQDPNDLRIRRRISPLPLTPFQEAFLAACKSTILRLSDAQLVLGADLPKGQALLGDTTHLANLQRLRPFDAALTSPPYAMALPYIDTQRLSLVWLDLLAAEEILPLEANLVGSREMRGDARRILRERFSDNADELPQQEYSFCRKLEAALSSGDGFRRKAVASLLYRYFTSMRDSFRAVHKQLKSGAPYALIVGHNHTILGGVRFDIDTPRHLASLASEAGWTLDEIVPLQAYRRYGYHMENAVSAESLILLRNQ